MPRLVSLSYLFLMLHSINPSRPHPRFNLQFASRSPSLSSLLHLFSLFCFALAPLLVSRFSLTRMHSNHPFSPVDPTISLFAPCYGLTFLLVCALEESFGSFPSLFFPLFLVLVLVLVGVGTPFWGVSKVISCCSLWFTPLMYPPGLQDSINLLFMTSILLTAPHLLS